MSPKSALGLALLVLHVAAHDPLQIRRAHYDHAHHARQPPAAASAPAVALASPAASPVASPGASAPAPGAPAPPAGPASAAQAAAPSVATAQPVPSIPGLPITGSLPSLTATDPGIPPLASLVSSMPSQATPQFAQTFAAGAQPPVSGAPALPTTTFDSSKYPSPTEVAPTDTSFVQEWLKELDGHEIPDIPPTTDAAACSSNLQAAADTTRCWWTCGGCTRDSDIHTCPNKMDWGLSFDDGPSPYTPTVLNFLNQHNLHATFFAIGSAIFYNWRILQAAYMAGHPISVHTWRHQPMTTLSNEQVVAELGYTRMLIKEVTGVTPKTWRPPYGDVDDRVRAIALAMGLQTIIWTRDPATGAQYDTNDWRIPAGQVTGPMAYLQFQNILKNATTLPTGFIVLEHDLFPQTVDLAVGYTIPQALSHQPPFSLKSINECLGKDIREAYLETATDKTVPKLNTNWTGTFLDGLTSNSTTSGGSGGSGGSKQGSGAWRVELGVGAGTLFLGALVSSVLVVFLA